MRQKLLGPCSPQLFCKVALSIFHRGCHGSACGAELSITSTSAKQHYCIAFFECRLVEAALAKPEGRGPVNQPAYIYVYICMYISLYICIHCISHHIPYTLVFLITLILLCLCVLDLSKPKQHCVCFPWNCCVVLDSSSRKGGWRSN